MKRSCINTCARRIYAIWFCAALVLPAALLQLPDALVAQQDGFIAGQLLVALPEMSDPRFAESVIYMVKHDREGAFGLVVNRPVSSALMEDVLKGFGIEEKRVRHGRIDIHYGGPVGTRQGFVLHSDDVVLENSTKVKDGIAMTSDPKMIRDIALGKGPRQFLLMIGYAGWAPGQLEGELKAKAWFSIPAEKEIIFGKQPEKKWRRAMDKRQIRL